MKQLATVFACVFALVLSSRAQGQLLQPGTTYIYEFSSLPLLERSSTGSAGAFFFLNPATLEGLQFRLELFENNSAEVPFVVQNVDSTWDPFAVASETPNVWQDLQGVARISMLMGPAPLEINPGLQVRVPSGSGDFFRYDQNMITFVPVPEPSTLALLAVAAPLIWQGVRRHLKKTAAKN